MSPETMASMTAIVGAIAGGLGKAAWSHRQKRRTDDPSPSAYQRLTKLEQEVMDPDGMVRTRFHELADAVNAAVGTHGVHSLRLDTLEQLVPKLGDKLETISGQIADLRVDLAERGNHCSHCVGT